MSRVNLAALALGVAGAWLVLVGLELAVLPHWIGADAMLALFRWQDELLGMPRWSSSGTENLLRDPVGFVVLTLSAAAIPTGAGVALSLSGLFLWRFVGRPADRRAAAMADEEPVRERALQRSIQERIARASATDPLPDTGPSGAEALERLDAYRRYRLAQFLHHAGLEPLAVEPPPAPWAAPPGGLASRRRFGPVLSILLLGGSAFSLLWGGLSTLSVRLLPEAAGFPPVPRVGLAAFTTCATAALVLFLAAWGAHLLQRQDRRLDERWRAAARATEEIVLAGYDECLEHLVCRPGDDHREPPARLVRALRVAALEALNEEGERSLAEIESVRLAGSAGSRSREVG